MSNPPSPPPPSDSELPALDPEIVADDEALGEAVDELVHRDPVARAQFAEIAAYQEILRAAVDSDVWRLALDIDELATTRFADAIVLVARWAFTEGAKSGGPPRGAA